MTKRGSRKERSRSRDRAGGQGNSGGSSGGQGKKKIYISRKARGSTGKKLKSDTDTDSDKETTKEKELKKQIYQLTNRLAQAQRRQDDGDDFIVLPFSLILIFPFISFLTPFAFNIFLFVRHLQAKHTKLDMKQNRIQLIQ